MTENVALITITESGSTAFEASNAAVRRPVVPTPAEAGSRDAELAMEPEYEAEAGS